MTMRGALGLQNGTCPGWRVWHRSRATLGHPATPLRALRCALMIVFGTYSPDSYRRAPARKRRKQEWTRPKLLAQRAVQRSDVSTFLVCLSVYFRCVRKIHVIETYSYACKPAQAVTGLRDV